MLDRLLKVFAALLKRFFGPLIPVVAALEIGLIGFRVLRIAFG